MKTTAKTAPVNRQNWGLQGLLLATSIAFGWILLPFYGVILWAVIIALLFSSLNLWLLPRVGNRTTVAALVTLWVVLLMVIVPFVLLTAALAHEAAQVYAQLQSGELNPVRYFRGLHEALPPWMMALLERFGLDNFEVLQRRMSAALAQGSKFLATQALSIGLNTFEFFAALCITLYLSFFLIRDGNQLAHVIRRVVPLAPEYKRELIEKFSTVILATVKGNLLVAAVQGALGGLAFWFLGVSGALLWAVLMAFLSLVPAVGAGLVWVPVALYFFVTGALWQAVALTAYGVLVIGLVDNLLRPILVGKDTRLPDYLVMITTLGGMAVFGINGFVLGPTIAAMFVAVWHIYAVTLKGQATA